ncbi:MAG: ferrochelatase [Myxococcota bacterium]
MSGSASGVSAAALERLAAADARHEGPPWRSLDPDRTVARSLHDVGRLVLTQAVDPALAIDPAEPEVFAEGLITIAEAMRQAFPHNIFGDLEFLAASLWRGAHRAPEGAVLFLRDQCRRVAALQARFGRGTAIRFRYVHDFVYGFDWARWVERDPDARAEIEPFAPEFLAFMDRRGQQLLELIAGGHDRKYPPLTDGQPRNPFGFSREPDAEIALHRRLAAEGLLPVEAWRVDTRPRWDRPFAELRRQRAVALGLGQAPLMGQSGP